MTRRRRTLTSMDTRRVGFLLTWLGAAVQVAGFGVDAYLHARDPNLAANEGVFTLSNVGHALVVAGIGMVVLGAFLALVGPRLAARPVLKVSAPLALVLVMTSTAAFASSSALGQGHAHGATTVDAAAPTATGSGGVTGTKHTHGDGTVFADVPLDRSTRDELAAQLVTARQVATGHPTVAMALQDGYQMVVPYVPLIGAHYMKFSLVDGRFDPAHPEMLLYEGTNADSQIVGLSYYLKSKDEPVGFAGGNDHWHRHIGLCVSQRTFTVIGSEETTEAACAARGGVKSDGREFWMVHAWVVPAWDSPQGVFSAEHADLK
jgi:hypothetical protein